MSVLVWDGKTLAADSYGNNGETCFPVTKLWTLKGKLCGAVGGLRAINKLIEWSTVDNFDPKLYPQEARDNKAQLMVVQKDDVLRYAGTSIAIRHGQNKLAIGEGMQYAYGALDMGATAEQAVAVAINRSVHCNGSPVSITWSE